MRVLVCWLILSSSVFSQVPDYYYNRNNSTTMRSYQAAPDVVRYYSPYGVPLGSSYTRGGRTNYYDNHNKHIGSATQINNGFRFFNSNGKPVGSVQGKR